MDLRPPGRTRSHLAAALAVAALLALALAASASAAPLRGTAIGASLRIGHAPMVPTGSAARGALPQSSVIDATVALEPRDPAALSAYAQAVSHPRLAGVPPLPQRRPVRPALPRRLLKWPACAPRCRRRGSPPARWRPTACPSTSPPRRAGCRSAFSTSFERYRTPNGRSVFANTTAPALPESVSGLVQGVVGLDSAAPCPRRRARPSSPRERPAPVASAAPTRRAGRGPGMRRASGSGGYTAGTDRLRLRAR